ncbi:hypothetical protein J6590_107855, partial [Homalodisca vitripennis]
NNYWMILAPPCFIKINPKDGYTPTSLPNSDGVLYTSVKLGDGAKCQRHATPRHVTSRHVTTQIGKMLSRPFYSGTERSMPFGCARAGSAGLGLF